MVDDTLDRERPSRSDSRLGENTDDFGALVGAGETAEGPNTSRELKDWTHWPGRHDLRKEAATAGSCRSCTFQISLKYAGIN